FGGAGPMHATQIAEELGTRSVLIPRYPGNLSALGLLTSDLKLDSVRTFLTTLSSVRLDDLERQYAEMEAAAREQLRADGVAADDVYFVRSLDLRYLGQAYELNVAVSADANLTAIAQLFHARYLATYGHSSEDQEVQAVNIRLAAFGRVPKPTLRPLGATADGGRRTDGATGGRGDGASGGPETAKVGMRPVYFGDRFWETPLYERDLLPVGARFDGPAIVEEAGATTVITPGWSLEVDEYGNLRLSA
ncbi:MAG: hydantoinase/oxoprolinase family protein, partial [Chloroflexi bacterium]|nr:hydantoinase/oxoprolinase family protein [Chloroflexota bacterium]